MIEFLVAEGESVANIHKRLQKVYGEDTISRSSVDRWALRVRGFQRGKAEVRDLERCGRPATSVTDDAYLHADTLIRKDRRIKIRQLASELSISLGSAETIIHNLGYSKVCARWVPRDLTKDQKDTRKEISLDLLTQYEEYGDSFLARIVTGDETWVHHFEPETKLQSMEWHHHYSPSKKKFKAVSSAGKVMATVFWDIEGVILFEAMPHGHTINSAAYIRTLENLVEQYKRVRPHKDVNQILLLHDNAPPHKSFKTQQAIRELGISVLPHPPYSPDLAPSDFYLFGPLKNALRGHKFQSDEAVIESVETWLKLQNKDFYKQGIHALVKRWRKVIAVCGDFVEK